MNCKSKTFGFIVTTNQCFFSTKMHGIMLGAAHLIFCKELFICKTEPIEL